MPLLSSKLCNGFPYYSENWIYMFENSYILAPVYASNFISCYFRPLALFFQLTKLILASRTLHCYSTCLQHSLLDQSSYASFPCFTRVFSQKSPLLETLLWLHYLKTYSYQWFSIVSWSCIFIHDFYYNPSLYYEVMCY